MNDVLRRVFATDSGMVAIWEPGEFDGIVDYDTWERELLEDSDISSHIQRGTFVPLNVHADGAYDCIIRAGSIETPAKLSDRESRYLLVCSAPYLFRSRGVLAISGLEHVGRSPGESGASVPLSVADWAVTIHLIDWPEEPGAMTPDGRPAPTALPDFIVLLNPATPGTRFRTKVDTFDKPENS